MSRELNLIAAIEDLPQCPSCGGIDLGKAEKDTLVKRYGRFIIDVTPGKWLECLSCAKTWQIDNED